MSLSGGVWLASALSPSRDPPSVWFQSQLVGLDGSVPALQSSPSGAGVTPRPSFLEAWLPSFFNQTSKLRGVLCAVNRRLAHSPP